MKSKLRLRILGWRWKYKRQNKTVKKWAGSERDKPRKIKRDGELCSYKTKKELIEVQALSWGAVYKRRLCSLSGIYQ